MMVGVEAEWNWRDFDLRIPTLQYNHIISLNSRHAKLFCTTEVNGMKNVEQTDKSFYKKSIAYVFT